MSAVVQTSSSAQTPSTTSTSSAPTKPGTKIESRPIQWATSTGATVLQHLAAQREQGKSKNNNIVLSRDDLINSKSQPSNSTSNNTKGRSTKPITSNLKGSDSPSSSKEIKKNTNGSSSAKPLSNSINAQSKSNGTDVKKENLVSTTALKRQDNGVSESDIKEKTVRRRKANRACSHCQKAHLTCDDSRPCERCVKKGLADTCTDGARKKAKYLLDDDELLELKREKEMKAVHAKENNDLTDDASSIANGVEGDHKPQPDVLNLNNDASVNSQNQQTDTIRLSYTSVPSSDPNWSAPTALNIGYPFVGPLNDVNPAPQQRFDHQTDLYGNSLNNFSPASGSNGSIQNMFGSENASLEYSILSSMLNGIDPTWLSGSPENQTGPNTTDNEGLGDVLQNASAFSHMGIDSMPCQFSDPTSNDVSPWRDSDRLQNPPSQSVEPLHHLDATLAMTGGSTPAGTDGLVAYDALEVPSPKDANRQQNQNGPSGKRDGRPSFANVSEQDGQASKMAAAAAAAGLDHKPDAVWKERVKHIYGDKTRPFPYTEGYHFLIKYATANLEKAEVLRIVRSLAIFRPSLIALQMPLTEDDEVFVERSIQRTILEFEKLISFSGTPTVVWRRTCEIVVVGNEFSMLSQWSKEYLMGRYIYEFFDKPSILEYWEKFALHAFENTAQSIMMPVTLKTSTGSTTRCAACFSIKRDIFDLPSLIVGNFLPILS